MNTIPSKEQMRASLYERHGRELQDRFFKSVVAVCGLGGLGSNIAVALARAGVGTLILIDFDKVDISNLNRQQYKADQIGQYKTDALRENILEISPYTTLITHTVKISDENITDLLCDADIICEAFDMACEKSMLVNNVLEKLPGKDIVSASGMAGLGSPNTIRTRRIAKHFYLSGDGVSDVEDSIGLLSSRVMLCAAHQAHTVLQIIAGSVEL